MDNIKDAVGYHGTTQQEANDHPQIALLTPYTGGNLGDAAIQDAMILNLRLRMPGAGFSGISLNSEAFSRLHGASAFPLCATNRPFYGMSTESPGQGNVPEKSVCGSEPKEPEIGWVRRLGGRIHWIGTSPRKLYSLLTAIPREAAHWVKGYRFLRSHDMLIVSGGGQLDEEWGGPWGHPYALFKWTLLARLARLPCVVASVGACKIDTKISRLFLSVALRMACYRSYREEKSRATAAELLNSAIHDPIVPDLAFSLPALASSSAAEAGSFAGGRTVVALSPIAFAKPGHWPVSDDIAYDRYLAQMAQLVSLLLAHDCCVLMVCSSIGDDNYVVQEIISRLDDDAQRRMQTLGKIAAIMTWKDLMASFHTADVLIASRLHSVILGTIAGLPAIALSFDAKVNRVMEDMDQTDYLLNIRSFVAYDVIRALERIQLDKSAVVERAASYQNGARSVSNQQYDTFANFALASHRRRVHQ